jgi:hypothetical protein
MVNGFEILVAILISLSMTVVSSDTSGFIKVLRSFMNEDSWIMRFRF